MAVFSSHLLDYADLGLGARVRAARQEQHLTLKQLSATTAVSVARLSEIENGRHVADVAQTLAIAAALGLSVSELLPRDSRIPFLITREGEMRARTPQHHHGAPDTGNEFWELADLFIGRFLNPMFGRIRQRQTAAELPLWQHHAEEFIFVLRGGVVLTIDSPGGRVRHELTRGDSAYLRPDVAHSLAALSDEPAETVQVQASASTPVEPGARWVWADVNAADGSGHELRRIGQRLRWLRQLHRWDLEEVAEQVGLTARQLQRFEAGERPIAVDRVLRFARLFGVPLAELLEPRPGAPPLYSVQRAKALDNIPLSARRTPVEREHAPQSKTCQQLALDVPGRHMFPCFIRLLNVDIERLTLHEHHGQEFLYVLDGELEMTTYVEQKLVTTLLRPGDSCYLDSSVPHLVRARTRNPFSETSAQVLDVFWSPLGEKYLFAE